MLKSVFVGLGVVLLCNNAAVALCSSYTTLSNGSPADATQVMANFNCAALTDGATLNAAQLIGVPTTYAPSNGIGLKVVGRSLDGAGEIEFDNTAGTQKAFIQADANTPDLTMGLAGGSLVTLTNTGFGIGTTTPSYPLEVRGLSGGPGVVDIVGSSSTLFTNYIAPNTGGTITISAGGGDCTYFGGSGWSCSSDERLKKGIKNLGAEHGLTALDKLRPVAYHLKGNPAAGTQLGFLAQDVKKVFPQAVTFSAAGNSAVGQHGAYLVNYTALIPPAVLAIQQLNATTAAQQKELDRLRSLTEMQTNELRALRQQMAQLKK